jgi:hypothetical protein
MDQTNEPCSFCNQCVDIQAALDKKLIGIADARLYNIRFGLDRPVYFGLYKALRFYRKAVKDICENNACGFCYGSNLENVLEKARMISA